MSPRYSVLWLLHHIDHRYQGTQMRQCSIYIVNGVILIPWYTRILYEMLQKQPSTHKIRVVPYTEVMLQLCVGSHSTRR